MWQVFVIFGVHWGFVPVMIQDLSTQGYSLLTGPLFAAVLAQGAAATAVMIKTRNKELKEIAGPAALSAVLAGITEPAIYGVTLRLKKPFIYGCIGGAIGGGIAAAGGSAAKGFVIPGLITMSAAVDVGNFGLQVAGTVIAMAIAFGLTMVLGFQDIPAKAALDDAAATGEVASEAVSVAAPAIGEVVSLESVPDKVFASGALGAGLAVVPAVGEAFAPVSGTDRARSRRLTRTGRGGIPVAPAGPPAGPASDPPLDAAPLTGGKPPLHEGFCPDDEHPSDLLPRRLPLGRRDAANQIEGAYTDGKGLSIQDVMPKGIMAPPSPRHRPGQPQARGHRLLPPLCRGHRAVRRDGLLGLPLLDRLEPASSRAATRPSPTRRAWRSTTGCWTNWSGTASSRS
jgi:hypothetical protein